MSVYIGILTAVFSIATLSEANVEKAKVFGKCFGVCICLMAILKITNFI